MTVNKDHTDESIYLTKKYKDNRNKIYELILPKRYGNYR